jgi:molecular chaperone Hsp33
MSEGRIRRFLFEGLDIRGAFVELGETWQALQLDRNYPPIVARLLGEMATVTALIAGQLKQAGRLTFQLRSAGPISLLVIDCDEQLRMRGMAQYRDSALGAASVSALLGGCSDGQLLLSLDLAAAREPYQSIVPLQGDSIAAIFQHFLEQSEQMPSRLFLAADADNACCLFLQKLPEADLRDPDGWNRVTGLAATVRDEELLQLEAETLLTRLFHEEIAAGGLRMFDPRPVVYHCPQDWDKIRGMLLTLGREELERLIRENGEVVVRDDICNHSYRFDAQAIAELFVEKAAPESSSGHTLH